MLKQTLATVGVNLLFPYKKYLMSLVTIVNSSLQLGRPKIIQIFPFCFEEYIISLYNEFKLEREKKSEKKKSNLVVKMFKT